MKVLLVSDTLHAGGAETFVLRLATKLKEFGILAEILVLNPDVENQELVKQFKGLVIHRISLPCLRWIKRVDKLLRLGKIDFSCQSYLSRQIILNKFLHYDVYHTHLFPVDLLFARIKKVHPEIVLISTLHGDYNEFDEYWQLGSPAKRLNWSSKVSLVKNQVNAWVYISKQQRELFNQSYLIPDKKLFHIYNGYESHNITPSNKVLQKTDELTFIMVARGIQPKGWEYLIKAFIKLEGSHKLILVGKGDFLDKLSQVYEKEGRINFVGFHPNPVELINEADVFVFPSVYKSESLPTVVIEALYCGVPVISTKIGELPDMLIGNETNELAGILVEHENEEDIILGLYEAMNLYIHDRALLHTHSILARLAFNKFKMDTCTKCYINLYREQLNDLLDNLDDKFKNKGYI